MMDRPNPIATAVQSMVEHLRQSPEQEAQATFQANTQLVHGLRTEATIRQFSFIVDEPQTLGGTDQGPNPVELVLAALGTCQEIVYAAYAAALNIPLRAVRIRVRGTLDLRGLFNVAPVQAGLNEVTYHVDIDSPAEPTVIRQLVELVDQHCPVLDTLRRPVATTRAVYLNGDDLTS